MVLQQTMTTATTAFSKPNMDNPFTRYNQWGPRLPNIPRTLPQGPMDKNNRFRDFLQREAQLQLGFSTEPPDKTHLGGSTKFNEFTGQYRNSPTEQLAKQPFNFQPGFLTGGQQNQAVQGQQTSPVTATYQTEQPAVTPLSQEEIQKKLSSYVSQPTWDEKQAYTNPQAWPEYQKNLRQWQSGYNAIQRGEWEPQPGQTYGQYLEEQERQKEIEQQQQLRPSNTPGQFWNFNNNLVDASGNPIIGKTPEETDALMKQAGTWQGSPKPSPPSYSPEEWMKKAQAGEFGPDWQPGGKYYEAQLNPQYLQEQEKARQIEGPPPGYTYLTIGNQRITIPTTSIQPQPSNWPMPPTGFPYQPGATPISSSGGVPFEQLTPEWQEYMKSIGQGPNTPEQVAWNEKINEQRIREKLLQDPLGWKNVGFKNPQEAQDFLNRTAPGQQPQTPTTGPYTPPVFAAPRQSQLPQPQQTIPQFQPGFLTKGQPIEQQSATVAGVEAVPPALIGDTVALPDIKEGDVTKKLREYLVPGEESEFDVAAQQARTQMARQIPSWLKDTLDQAAAGGHLETGLVNKIYENIATKSLMGLEDRLAQLAVAKAQSQREGLKRMGEFGLTEQERRGAEAFQGQQAALGRNLQREMPSISATAEKGLIQERASAQASLDVVQHVNRLQEMNQQAKLTNDANLYNKAIAGSWEIGREMATRSPDVAEQLINSPDMQNLKTQDPNLYSIMLGGLRSEQVARRGLDYQQTLNNSQQQLQARLGFLYDRGKSYSTHGSSQEEFQRVSDSFATDLEKQAFMAGFSAQEAQKGMLLEQKKGPSLLDQMAAGVGRSIGNINPMGGLGV